MLWGKDPNLWEARPRLGLSFWGNCWRRIQKCHFGIFAMDALANRAKGQILQNGQFEKPQKCNYCTFGKIKSGKMAIIAILNRGQIPQKEESGKIKLAEMHGHKKSPSRLVGVRSIVNLAHLVSRLILVFVHTFSQNGINHNQKTKDGNKATSNESERALGN
jgi:hypothetical protein